MHVIVTGASSGIGEAIVREYIKRGANVTLVARRRELLDKIAEDAGKGRAHVATCDLTDPEHATDWLPNAEEALGPVDCLVNNAGVQIVGPAVSTSPVEGERLLKLNVNTPLRIMLTVLPKMISRGHGTIVNVASMAGIAPTPGMFYYNASKAALAAASEGLGGEVRRHGVHIVTVYPGPVTTPMEVAARTAYDDKGSLSRVPTGTAEELARMIADAVKYKRQRVIYPRIYGLARHFPNFTRWFVDRMTPPLRELEPKKPERLEKQSEKTRAAKAEDAG